MKLSTIAAAVLMTVANVAALAADGFPTRPIRLVVPYPAGGATDILARQVAAKLGPVLGQNVIVENKPGASGVIGFDFVARAEPDGYTLLMGTANMIINAAFGKVPYDPVRDFAPISTLVSSQNVLVVRPSLDVTRLSDLIAYAKKEPGKLTYGTSGIGTPLITMELLKSLAGIDMRSVPYRGDAPAITDVMAGQIDMYASTIAGLRGYIDGKQLVALGVTSLKRASSLSDVPTIAEAGVPGYELNSWYGILAPKRTPREIVEKLNKVIVDVIATADMQRQMIDGGADPLSSTTQQFEAVMASDLDRYTRLVKDLKLAKE